MNKILIILVGLIVFYLATKSKFVNTVYNNQSIPKGCDFEKEPRPYPSGHVPGSYLGLSRQEQESLLIKFLNYHPDDI